MDFVYKFLFKRTKIHRFIQKVCVVLQKNKYIDYDK